MTRQLFNKADVITPNGVELVLLGHNEQEDQAAAHILEAGCPAVLATGGHGEGPDIINILYRHHEQPKQWSVERVGGEYHGTGCTLAAAIAAGRAAGLSLEPAIERAQLFVSKAINGALTVGKGQPVPDRSTRHSS